MQPRSTGRSFQNAKTKTPAKKLELFERYLPLLVQFCMGAGILVPVMLSVCSMCVRSASMVASERLKLRNARKHEFPRAQYGAAFPRSLYIIRKNL